MKNHNVQWENPLYMVMFNSYVSLPEGICIWIWYMIYIYIYTHTHLHIISGQWYRQVWKWGIAQTSIFKVKLTIDSWLLRSPRHILVWSPKVWFRFFLKPIHWEWKIREKSLVGGLEPWNFITFIQLGIIIPTDKLIFFRTCRYTTN